MSMDGAKFLEFFKWLSNSLGVIANSTEGEPVSLDDPGDWMKKYFTT